jgi:hypothetical protein
LIFILVLVWLFITATLFHPHFGELTTFFYYYYFFFISVRLCSPWRCRCQCRATTCKTQQPKSDNCLE